MAFLIDGVMFSNKKVGVEVIRSIGATRSDTIAITEVMQLLFALFWLQ